MKKMITAENIRNFAYVNENICKKPIRGIVLSFFGLGTCVMYDKDIIEGEICAEQGLLYAAPYTNPWSWMNDQAAAYVQDSLKATLGDAGSVFITVAMVVFAFTTLLGNLFYVEKSFHYLLGKEPGKMVKNCCYILAALIIFLGAGSNADLLWGIADILMGGMTLINIPVIFTLGKYAFRALEDYEKKMRKDKDIVFQKTDIDLQYETDCWN